MQPQPPAQQPYLRPRTALDKAHMGKYEVLCRLATGGMAELFLAYQRGLAGFRKVVVLKSILPDVRGEEELVRMFLSEAQITAQFNHPHIAQVFDLDIDGDVLFLAMEFVQGCTLVELARACDKAKEAIPIGFTVRAARDTALALHYAHTFVDPRGRKQTVIHRDVAEKNIMVTHEGTTKLLDFGIAKHHGKAGMTSAGQVKGSTGYMSPEQVRGEELDLRSDVFALGVVLHECLTGYRLFRGRTPEESMMKTLEAQVTLPSATNPSVPRPLDDVVMRALSRERTGRHASALELARDLEKAVGPELWTEAQCGALVQRYFGSRLEQVRTVITSLNEKSAETGIERVIAAIQAAKGAPADEPKTKPVPPPSDLTVPAPISDVQRAMGRVDETTEESPAHVPAAVVRPTELDFALEPESTPALGAVLEHVTDVNSAHVPANPPAPPPPAGTTAASPLPGVSTEIVASLLGPVPPPPLAAPSMQVMPTSPAAPRVVSPASPSRRVLRRTKSRTPLYVGAALALVVPVVVALFTLQVGPFARAKPAPPPVPLVVPPPPPPAPVVEPEPEKAEVVAPPPVEPAPSPEPEPEPEPKPKPKKPKSKH